MLLYKTSVDTQNKKILLKKIFPLETTDINPVKC